MSTFNQPSSLGPKRVVPGEEVHQEPEKPEQRPSPEKVSPTQQGKFLGALENKEKKKEIKPVSGKVEEGESGEESAAGIFGLAGKSKEKPRKGLSQGSDEKGQQQDQPLAVAPPLPIGANEEVVEEPAEGPKPVQVYAPTENVNAPVYTPPKEEIMEIQPEGALPEVPAAPQKPVVRGEGADISGAPVQRGPVARTPVQRGAAAQQAVSPFADVSEKKERVAFQPITSTKKEEVAVTPTIQITSQPEITIKPQEATPDVGAAREALLELFKQAVDAVATVVTTATTTTVVTVRYPPIFEGASILVTEYSSAPKQYNITFGNLSPDARRLIEAAGSETQLRQSLIDKGYTLHMMTIEAQPPTISTTGTETATSEGERKGQFSEKGGRGGEKGEGGALA
jgi:hypothetical protein